MILAKRKAPPWAYGIFGVAAGGAALFFALLWFGREEMIVTDYDIVIRRRLWKFSKQWRFPRSAVTGVRVAFSGPPPHFGVRIERGEERPLAVFDGFTDSLDAHEAARSVLRALELKK
ncbi:MAG: hypothetical protein IPN90_04145 [Elusimicrobia bacterium]|nr:hypothetical protein [Elusimicrobiota bacterium]